MKIKSLLPLAAAVLVVGLVGCKKETPLEKALNASKEAASDASAALKKAASAAEAEAKKLTAAAAEKAQGLIAQAQSLVSSGKYQDALNTLNELKGLQLTAEQQKLVDDLKAQIQKALAAKSSDAVGNLLPK